MTLRLEKQQNREHLGNLEAIKN
jgi:hypothetical protein